MRDSFVRRWAVSAALMVAASCLASHAAAEDTPTCPADGKLKVFVLAGQSNMVGFGQVFGEPGTMEWYVRKYPDKYGHLVDESGKPRVRNDVWVVNISYPDKPKMGWLTVGFGASEEHIGPEYGFGWAVGDYFEDPVLIIKCAWGGRSLYHNFRPPSSADYPTPQKDGDMGFQYYETIRQYREITGNLKKYFPDYDGRGFELVGFGWHQGWNDRINAQAVDAYESNLVHLINDLRRDLGVADLPFVIANTGMGGWDIPPTASYKQRVEKLMEVQLAVADPEKHPEFAGTVAGVETRDFQRSTDESPSRQEYHWNRNWETYYLIGRAMGQAMIGLLEK
ncbi:MAG: sialate O-acetylesterase [Planctomycetota bacterium]|nr:MAG: sialate O-acetylesterase [Planctomycetota bacterium]